MPRGTCGSPRRGKLTRPLHRSSEAPDRGGPAPSEVTEIAKQATQDKSPDEIVAAGEVEAKGNLEGILEEAFKQEVAILLAGDGRLRKAGSVRRTIVYKGFPLDLKVPRLRLPNGGFLFPPRFEELNKDPGKILALLRHGVPVRQVGSLQEELYGRKVPGGSPSAVSRVNIDAGKPRWRRSRTGATTRGRRSSPSPSTARRSGTSTTSGRS